MSTARAPLFLAIGLLMLPNLYVGSYLALVTPGGGPVVGQVFTCGYASSSLTRPLEIRSNYRIDDADAWTAAIFQPLERIDRKLRPGANWEGTLNSPPGKTQRRLKKLRQSALATKPLQPASARK